MRKYIFRRLALFIPSLIGASIGIFVLLRVIPGDVAAVILSGPSGEASFTREQVEELRHELGLDRSIAVQYLDWVWGLVRLDMGTSFRDNYPVARTLKERFPRTLQLTVMTLVVIVGIAIPVGILAALKQDTWLDYALRGVAIIGLAAPSFWVGLIVVLVLSRYFDYLPPLGFVNLWDNPVVGFQQLIFPALALGFSTNGLLLRITRAQLLEVLREDYIRTARAKGLRERLVVLRHAVRNALLPVVTIGGFLVAGLLSGSVAIELIFGIPGMGQALITAIRLRDLPVVEVFVMFVVLLYLVINLVIDISYALLDPRIRYD